MPATPDTSPPSATDRPTGSVPGPLASRLGHAGLIPFFAGALLVWLVRADVHPYVAMALAGFAAVVVSFLGGIAWGLAMQRAEPAPALLAWGVVASGLAWLALMMPPQSGLVVDGVLLLACYAVDRRLYPAHGAGHWLTLRFRLSAGAALACFIGAAGS